MLKNFRLGLVPLAMLLLPIGEVPVRAAPCDEATQQARAWADRIVAENVDLPPYSEIIQLPPLVQRELVARFTPDRKAEFWQAHIRSFLALPLTDTQEQRLREVADSVTIEIFEKAQKEGQAAVFRDALWASALLSTAFDSDQVAAIAFNQQPPRRPQFPALELGDLPTCSCSVNYGTEEECFGQFFFCTDSNPPTTDCEPKSFGCGYLWLFGCDGRCCRTNNPNLCF